MGPQKLNNWISHGLKLWKCCVFELWSFFGVFKLIWQIPRNQKVKNEKFAPIFFDKKWVNFNRLWVNMVSIRMIVKSGQKNELQNLGFRTYYNHCANMTSFFFRKLSNTYKQLWPSTSWVLKNPTIQIFRLLLIKHIVCSKNYGSYNYCISGKVIRCLNIPVMLRIQMWPQIW